ncbi:MAG: hypothetical protein ACYCVV_10905 [Acidimicrobiales bacterium]
MRSPNLAFATGSDASPEEAAMHQVSPRTATKPLSRRSRRDPDVSGVEIAASLGEWCKSRGYDPATRTYAGATS